MVHGWHHAGLEAHMSVETGWLPGLNPDADASSTSGSSPPARAAAPRDRRWVGSGRQPRVGPTPGVRAAWREEAEATQLDSIAGSWKGGGCGDEGSVLMEGRGDEGDNISHFVFPKPERLRLLDLTGYPVPCITPSASHPA